MAGENKVILNDFQHMKRAKGWINVIYDISKTNLIFFIIFIFYQRIDFVFIHAKKKRKHG